jgi:hypothetical protein
MRFHFQSISWGNGTCAGQSTEAEQRYGALTRNLYCVDQYRLNPS